MAYKSEIEQVKLFLPPEFTPTPLDMERLSAVTGKQFQYASRGRHAMGHILRSLRPTPGTVLISPYMCPTVEKKLRDMGYEVAYFDIDPLDMNPSAESIRERLNEQDVSAVVAASLYGNPADMVNIESICREAGVTLIDDAAQSFGATLEGRWIGCFGDGGFFAFSPGKSTAAHMGALFWTKQRYYIAYTHHNWLHRLAYHSFYWNRQRIYDNPAPAVTGLLQWLEAGMERLLSIENDVMAPFENTILGGAVAAAINHEFEFRKEVSTIFAERFRGVKEFRIVSAMRGEAQPHKIVLVFPTHAAAAEFQRKLLEKNVFSYGGYSVVEQALERCPNYRAVQGCIVELPVEDHKARMEYMVQAVEDCLK